MAYAVQALTHNQTYPERPPENVRRDLEQMGDRKRELEKMPPPIPPRSPGGTITLADGTVIHSSVAPGV